MTKLIFNDGQHAHGRLHNTLVRYKGEPVIIHDLGRKAGSFTLEAVQLKDGRNVQDMIEAFDLEPVPLGNIVVGDRFGFFTRRPERRWKQGLTTGSMVCNNMPWDVGQVRLNSREMRTAILGLNPTFEKAYEDVERNVTKALPFDRNFGLGRTKKGEIVLIHRGREVGIVDDDIFIDKKYFYLQEDLLRVLNL